MAEVQVQVAGGAIQKKEAATVECLSKLVGCDGAGWTATVNGEPQESDYELSDYEFVTFAKAVKAG